MDLNLSSYQLVGAEEDVISEILAPYTYFLQVKGKELRANLVMSFNHWLKVPTDRLNELQDILNMVYVSCFLFDDIQDNTNIRGMVPAAHCVYGIPLTINAASHVLLLALEKASKISPEICKVIMEEYLEIFRGQGIEIYWRDNYLCPSEEQFMKMIKQKTGSFIMIAIRSMQLLSDNKTDYSKLVYLLGAYFQIQDDYCNICHQEGLDELAAHENKKAYAETRFCEDITEGKFTLPIIYAMKTSYGEQIMNILRQRTHDVNLKQYCLSLLEKSGSLQYTRDFMTELDREARAEVARLEGNPGLISVLDRLLSWQK